VHIQTFVGWLMGRLGNKNNLKSEQFSMHFHVIFLTQVYCTQRAGTCDTCIDAEGANCGTIIFPVTTLFSGGRHVSNQQQQRLDRNIE
jgi:hypothetical protein